MSINLSGKKFFLKICTRCRKQFTDADVFKNHIKDCGSSVFKSAERAKTIADIPKNPYKKQLFGKDNVVKENGFSELSKVTKSTENESKEVKEIEKDFEDVQNVTQINEEIEKEETVLQEKIEERINQKDIPELDIEPRPEDALPKKNKGGRPKKVQD